MISHDRARYAAWRTTPPTLNAWYDQGWPEDKTGGPTVPSGRSGHSTDSCSRRKLITGWLLFWLAIASLPNFAAGQVPQEKSDAPSANERLEPAPPLVVDPQLKKNAVWLAFMMWGGIIFGGVILLTLVVMWGNRTRRLARSPLPPVAKRDELWFLKPKPPAADADPAGPSDSGSNSG